MSERYRNTADRQSTIISTLKLSRVSSRGYRLSLRWFTSREHGKTAASLSSPRTQPHTWPSAPSPSPAVDAFAFFTLHRDHSYPHCQLPPRNFDRHTRANVAVARPSRINREIVVVHIYLDSRVFTSGIVSLPVHLSLSLSLIFIGFLSIFYVRKVSLFVPFSETRPNARIALAPVSVFSEIFP